MREERYENPQATEDSRPRARLFNPNTAEGVRARRHTLEPRSRLPLRRRGWVGHVSWARARASSRACPGSTSRPTYSGRSDLDPGCLIVAPNCARTHTHTHTQRERERHVHARTHTHTQIGELPGRGCVHNRADAEPLRDLNRPDFAGAVPRIFQESSKNLSRIFQESSETAYAHEH